MYLLRRYRPRPLAQALEIIDPYFKSGNSVKVDRAWIKREDWEEFVLSLAGTIHGGDLPAPLEDPGPWPEGFAQGFNACVQLSHDMAWLKWNHVHVQKKEQP